MTESPATSRLPGVRALLIRLLVACLLPGALGAALLFAHEYRQGRQQLEQDMLHTARALAQAVDSRLLQAEAVGRTLSSSPFLAQEDLSVFHARARRVVDELGLVANVRLTDRSGRALLDTDVPYGSPPLADADVRSLAELFATGRFVVSDLATARRPEPVQAAVHVPVMLDGRVAYALTLGISPAPLTSLLKNQALPPTWLASVLDRAGTIAARTTAAEQWVGHPATAELRRALASEPEGTLQARTKDGVAMITFHSRAVASGWSVAIGIPRQHVVGALQQALTALGLGVLAMVALGLLLARSVGGRIAASVEALTGPAAALGRGEPVRLPKPDTRETADVAAAMGRAAELLQQREATLDARRQELADARQRMRAALHSMSDALVITDREGRFIEANDAFFTVHRLDRADAPADAEAAAQRLLLTDLDGAPLPPDRCPLQRALQGESAADELVGLRCAADPQGPAWVLSYSFAPIRDDAGAPEGAVLVGRDVTEHRRRQHALVQAQERLGLAQRAARAGLWDWDVDRDQLAWSDEFYDLMGLDPTAVQPSLQAWLEVVHPDDRQQAVADMTAALHQRGPVDMSYRVQLPAGEVRWLNSIGQTFEEGSQGALRMSGICIDTTARHTTEAELAQYRGRLEELVDQRTRELALAKDAAESANRSKSVFLANMSHEIRTPMNAVLGLTHLLLTDETKPQQRERLALVESSARHLLQTINDILDLSKVEAGKLELELVDFDRDGLLAAAVDVARPAADAKGLELVLDAHDLPTTLRGDPQYLMQALVNLLSNAVKFTERGWVRLHVDRLQTEADRLKLRFEVTDTGIGIAADRHARLFSPFEQADASTTRQHGGTGLGLALTRHLALLMGGEVGVHSEPGRGSCFWFTAWVGVPTGAAPTSGPAPAVAAGLRALVVDDLPEALEALCRPLAAWGFALWRADGAEQARAVAAALRAQGTPPDLLIVDQGLVDVDADGDGLALLQALERELGVARGATVLTVAGAAGALRDRAQAAGVGAVLLKPVTASALHDTLLHVLGRGTGPVPRPAQAAAPRADVLAGRRVLLVEDDAVNQIVACELLAAAGVVVDLVENGAAAVERVLRDEPDLVLMDMHMPVMDGLAATRAIRAAGRRVPIVAMTANAFSEDRAACLAAGMNDHIGKPVDPPLLYAVLSKWLARP